MQENSEEKEQNSFRLEDLPIEDGRNFVNAFAWLIKQDKKQNPALYKIKKQTND